MARETYLVTGQQNRWEVAHGTERLGPFGTRAKALHAAIEGADQGGRLSGEASVLVLLPEGDVYTAWEYGRDGVSGLHQGL